MPGHLCPTPECARSHYQGDYVPKLGETEFKNPLEDPGKANAEIAAMLSDQDTNEKPVIEFPQSDLVQLPGGYVDKSGKTAKTATVRELTGEDEEAMARAVMSNNPIHFINTIIECGVVRLGDFPEHETREILPHLLVGDREQIFVGIRIATYGNEVEILKWPCPFCGEQSDLTVHLDEDIRVRKIDPTDTEFEVKLRKGGTARVRLMTGEIQNEIWEADNKFTKAQMDTRLLSKCLVSVDGAVSMSDAARSLGLYDRKKILKELVERQPGPQLNDIKFDCKFCGKEVTLAIGLEELFLNFELLSGV